ncbi:hypothetical protein Slala05_83720 [Streptomyces lavendulae subsp. lavendulae]|nr:hypothetical protein Slala05_83720 [Streptomyces lavendulae subsp. lavendulae]
MASSGRAVLVTAAAVGVALGGLCVSGVGFIATFDIAVGVTVLTADLWHRWARAVGDRPWRCLAIGVLVLGTLSTPLAAIQLGHVDAGASPVDRGIAKSDGLVSVLVRECSGGRGGG